MKLDYRSEAPEIIRGFLTYHETIKGHSKATVDEYYLDLRNFFRFLKIERGLVPRATELDDISIRDVDLDFVKSVTVTEFYDYLAFMDFTAADVSSYDRKTVSADFCGTNWSSSGFTWVRPDSIETFVDSDGITAESYLKGTNSAPTSVGLYDTEYLAKKDKYSMAVQSFALFDAQRLGVIGILAVPAGDLLLRDELLHALIDEICELLLALGNADAGALHGFVDGEAEIRDAQAVTRVGVGVKLAVLHVADAHVGFLFTDHQKAVGHGSPGGSHAG